MEDLTGYNKVTILVDKNHNKTKYTQLTFEITKLKRKGDQLFVLVDGGSKIINKIVNSNQLKIDGILNESNPES